MLHILSNWLNFDFLIGQLTLNYLKNRFLSILVRRFLQFSHSFSDPSKQFLNIICRTGLLTFLHPDLVNTSAIITKTFQFFPWRKKVGSAFRCVLLDLLKNSNQTFKGKSIKQVNFYRFGIRSIGIDRVDFEIMLFDRMWMIEVAYRGIPQAFNWRVSQTIRTDQL